MSSNQTKKDLLRYNNIYEDYHNNLLTLTEAARKQGMAIQTYYDMCKRLNKNSVANGRPNKLKDGSIGGNSKSNVMVKSKTKKTNKYTDEDYQDYTHSNTSENIQSSTQSSTSTATTLTDLYKTADEFLENTKRNRKVKVERILRDDSETQNGGAPVYYIDQQENIMKPSNIKDINDFEQAKPRNKKKTIYDEQSKKARLRYLKNKITNVRNGAR